MEATNVEEKGAIGSKRVYARARGRNMQRGRSTRTGVNSYSGRSDTYRRGHMQSGRQSQVSHGLRGRGKLRDRHTEGFATIMAIKGIMWLTAQLQTLGCFMDTV